MTKAVPMASDQPAPGDEAVERLARDFADIAAMPDDFTAMARAALEAAGLFTLQARVAELERCLEESSKAVMKEIDNRDWAQDCLQKAHIALGGDGEWTGKMPAEMPPDSGDLHHDVPALAAEVLARAEKAEARVAELTEEAETLGVAADRERKRAEKAEAELQRLRADRDVNRAALLSMCDTYAVADEWEGSDRVERAQLAADRYVALARDAMQQESEGEV